MKTKAEILMFLVCVLSLGLVVAGCGGTQSAPTIIPPTATSIPPTPTPVPPTSTPVPSTPTPMPPTATPTPVPPTPTHTPKPHEAKVSVEALNLREGPGTVYSIVGVLNQGDTLTVIGRSPDEGWIEVITAGGEKGWCSALEKYVQLNVDLDEVTIAQIPPTPTLVATATPSPSPTEEPIETPTIEISPTQTPTVEASPTPIPEEQIYVLYFYFGAEGCPYSRMMAPKVEQFHQEYGVAAVLPDKRDSVIGVLAAALPPIQEPVPEVKFEVRGVKVGWWGGSTNSFVQATGITFPVVGDPGLSVDTSRIPVTVVQSKQTGVYRVATVGNVSFANLESHANAKANAIAQGQQGGAPASGSA